MTVAKFSAVHVTLSQNTNLRSAAHETLHTVATAVRKPGAKVAISSQISM